MASRTTIRVERGDITEFTGDAIVNAANNQLRLGSGVAGAIRRKGGPSIQQECYAHGPIHVGEAAITRAGDLPARFVIHAAAMGDEPASLASIEGSTRQSLELAEDHDVRTIAFPILASGVAGFPLEEATRTMLRVIRAYLVETSSEIEELVLYGYSEADAAAVQRVLDETPT
ncbi:MAG: Appr-1-p processing protein [Gemmatimonas sp. SG8_38_2]|nr:MAG: Appr-1-p processing protein [Gemmatimonas sp. SG8_38_2]